MKPELLFEEYREGVLECLHFGTACVVDETGVTWWTRCSPPTRI